MKTNFLIVICLIFSFNISALDIIKRTEPSQFSNDFADLLSSKENSRINNILDSISKKQNAEIVLLIVKDLNNYSIREYGNKIIKKWSLGKNNDNKGVIILIKPKTISKKGEIWVGSTDKLSNSLSDIATQRILETVIIPNFKNGQYFKGITEGITAISSLLNGQFETLQISKKSENEKITDNVNTIIIIGIIAIIILLTFLYLGVMNYFGSLENLLIIGIISIIIGLIGLIFRYEIIHTFFDIDKFLLDSLLNTGRVKTTYWTLIIITSQLVITGIIFTLKSLLAKMKSKAA